MAAMALRVSLIVLLAGARGVVGWGAVGHRTVGALALKHMSPTALIEANRLLGTALALVPPARTTCEHYA